MSIFKKIRGARSTFNPLPEGFHVVTLTKHMEIDSFTDHNGEVKKDLPEWADATPQYLIAVKGEKGSLMHRLNGRGYIKYESLSDKQIESGEFIECESYACTTNEDGKIVRIEDKVKTEAAERIMASFLFATAGEEGTVEALDEVVADKEQFVVKVVNKPYDGKENLEIEAYYSLEDAKHLTGSNAKTEKKAVVVDLEE